MPIPLACSVGKLGGFGSYLLAMDQRTYELVGANYPGNRAEDVKNPGLGWITAFVFVIIFAGIFSLVPLRKVKFLSFVPTLSLPIWN